MDMFKTPRRLLMTAPTQLSLFRKIQNPNQQRRQFLHLRPYPLPSPLQDKGEMTAATITKQPKILLSATILIQSIPTLLSEHLKASLCLQYDIIQGTPLQDWKHGLLTELIFPILPDTKWNFIPITR